YLSDSIWRWPTANGMRESTSERSRFRSQDHRRETGKGGKDRVMMLPATLTEALQSQLAYSRSLWAEDRSNRIPGVFVPEALARKYPRAAESWAWHWVSPSPTLSTDPRTQNP